MLTTNPTIGRVVGFVLPVTHKRAGAIVPAMITRVCGDGPHVQLTPFVDIANDSSPTANECSSVGHDQAAKTLRTWHWLSHQ